MGVAGRSPIFTFMNRHLIASAVILAGMMPAAGIVAQIRSGGLLATVDHLVYATPELNAGVERIEKLLGVKASPGGQHPGRGTRNALLALGPTSYLEIIGPDPEQPTPALPRPFGIDDLKEPRLVAWAAKSMDLARLAREAGRNGVRLGEVISGSRRRADGVMLSWRYTDPRDDRGGRSCSVLHRLGDDTTSGEHRGRGAVTRRVACRTPGREPNPGRPDADGTGPSRATGSQACPDCDREGQRRPGRTPMSGAPTSSRPSQWARRAPPPSRSCPSRPPRPRRCARRP